LPKPRDAKAGAREEPTGRQVLDYLRERPNFLRKHPEVMATLAPPTRVLGNDVADIQEAMIRRLQTDQHDLKEMYRELVVTSRDNLASQGRVHAAVLATLGARTFEHLIEIATTDLAVHLDVDVVGLCVETVEAPCPRAPKAGVRILEVAAVDALIGQGREARLRNHVGGQGDPAVFGAGAGLVHSEALIRLDFDTVAPTGLLALGSRHDDRFQVGQGTELLSFLARVLARSIRSWLSLPA